MKAKHLLDAVNDIDYSLIEEAENMTSHQKNRIPRGKKTVLIAAAAVLLLCITAAAAGILWGTPEVIVEDGTHTLFWNNGYLTLPEESVQTIYASRTSDHYGSFHTFATIAEWTDFYGIPFVSSTNLVPYSDIQTVVWANEPGSQAQLSIMESHMNVERYREGTEERLWRGSMTVFAPLNEEAAKSASWTRNLSDEMNAEILAEDTTAAGVPYVISKITHDSNADSCNLLLYYGHEAVFYELEVSACVGADEARIFEDLVDFAQTLQIMSDN